MFINPARGQVFYPLIMLPVLPHVHVGVLRSWFTCRCGVRQLMGAREQVEYMVK